MSVGRCHSAFQHYEMFHGHGACHGGGNNYGSIFNINYSCNGGHGNFWSGLGAGLGYGLGGWLMGGLNMLGGWLGFGGMGFGGGWGMGMPMFGWGGGATTNNVTSNNTGRVRTKTIEKTDSESSAINDAREQVQKLQAKKDPVTDAEIQALKDQIAALTAKDGINDTENDDQIAMLKADFEKFKAGITSDSSEDDTVVTETGDADDTGVVDIAGINLDKVKELEDSQIDKLTKDQARKNLGLENKLTLCIMGGSQGAKTINDASIELLQELTENYNLQIIFQTGKKNFEDVTKKLKDIYPNYENDKNLIVRPYFEDMVTVLKASDIAISRAGSLSISELCASGIAPIFVPYPYAAADHQRKNAKNIVAQNAGLYIEDSEVTAKTLLELIKSLVENPEKLNQIQQASLNLAKFDGIQNIVKQILEV